ncbi:hypothetical protein GCM10028825_02520 [Spirosoma agri]
MRYAKSALDSIFAFGYHYQKVGVMLTDLVPAYLFVQSSPERVARPEGHAATLEPIKNGSYN